MSYLKSNKKAKWILSIDQSAAYNRVNRNKYYKIIQKNKILTDDKLALMKFHHSQPMIVLGNHKTKPLNSLSQGAVTSPHGFNLYINSLLKSLETKFTKPFGYADDILIVGQTIKNLEVAWKEIQKWCKDFSMKVNINKCAIMRLHQNTKPKIERNDKSFAEIPLQNNIKYLGVWINSSLNCKEHLDRISKKINFQKYRLLPLLKASFKLRLNLFKMLIAPLFDMASALFIYSKKIERNLFINKYTLSLKKFLLMKKNSSRKLTKALFPFDINERYEGIWNKNNINNTLQPPSNPLSKDNEFNIYNGDKGAEIITLNNIIGGFECKTHKTRLTKNHCEEHVGPLNFLDGSFTYNDNINDKLTQIQNLILKKIRII